MSEVKKYLVIGKYISTGKFVKNTVLATTREDAARKAVDDRWFDKNYVPLFTTSKSPTSSCELGPIQKVEQ